MNNFFFEQNTFIFSIVLHEDVGTCHHHTTAPKILFFKSTKSQTKENSLSMFDIYASLCLKTLKMVMSLDWQISLINNFFFSSTKSLFWLLYRTVQLKDRHRPFKGILLNVIYLHFVGVYKRWETNRIQHLGDTSKKMTKKSN